MANPKPTLFLLDAMALIYRAYYAMNKNPRISSKGLNTSAVLGFANTLIELLKKEKPTHIGVAFDTIAPTVRHDDYAFYKANRAAMPEDLSKSIPWIKELIDAFQIPILFVEGYEADDIIGTLAKEAERKGFTVYMMTPDKDFGQLVSENIFIYKPAIMGNSPVIMGVAEVCDKYAIKRPEQLIDILGIWGDASDNIPGIPGIGEVGAKKLLAQFDSMEDMIENADKIANEKMREKVLQNIDQALMSKQLATIITDVPIDFVPSALEWSLPKPGPLQKLFDELEFRQLGKRLFDDLYGEKQVFAKPINQEATLFDQDFVEPSLFSSPGRDLVSCSHDYQLVQDKDAFDEFFHVLAKQTSFCFDTETTSLDSLTAELVGLSFAFEPAHAWFVRVSGNPKFKDYVLDQLKPIFEDHTIEKCGQNLKFDLQILMQAGITVSGKLFDTMLAHYILHPDMRHNLDYLCESYLDYRCMSFETLIGGKGSKLTAKDVDPLRLCEYACEDADMTLQLRQLFEPQLDETAVRKLFDTIETPLIPVLAQMEREGVAIDIHAIQDYSVQLGTEIKLVEHEIHELAGHSFNVSSPKQLGEVLFDELKITEKPGKTKTKQYSTGEEVLQKLAHKHPIVEKILDYRSLTKLKSTYVDALPLLIHPLTGRVHTNFNQAVTSTGRLSSNNPNLQNIPIRTARGREIRKTFIPRNEEFTLVSADYSQIELRIMAALSGDVAMQDAFLKGTDIHTATASKVYGVGVDEVSKEQRRNAKMVNFGIIYGISAFGLSERLGIARSEAAAIIDNYFQEFPGVKSYMDNVIEQARKKGFVETMAGRRRYLPDINSANGNVRGFAERNAINAPIQGSSADMIKIAMINIHRYIGEQGLKSRLVLQVHDELVFDVYKPEAAQLKPVIIDLMRNAMQLSVPIEVDLNEGSNWLEAH